MQRPSVPVNVSRKSRPGEGIVTLEHIARNQHGEVVARAVRTTLVQKQSIKEAQ